MVILLGNPRWDLPYWELAGTWNHRLSVLQHWPNVHIFRSFIRVSAKNVVDA